MDEEFDERNERILRRMILAHWRAADSLGTARMANALRWVQIWQNAGVLYLAHQHCNLGESTFSELAKEIENGRG